MGRLALIKKFLPFLVLLIVFLGTTFDDVLNDKNKQAEVTIKEINECRDLLRTDSLTLLMLEKNSDSIQTTISTLDTFLNEYKNEKFLNPEEITSETQSVAELGSEVQKTQNSLKNKIISLYKHGKNYELELLLSSRSPNEYLRRNEYLQKFALSRKKEIQDLKNKEFVLNEKKKLLSLSTSSKRFYIESKRIERKILADSLNSINYKQDELISETGSNNEKTVLLALQLNNIKNFISNFIQNKNTFKASKTSRLSYSSEDLGKIKGTINLPVDIGLIRTDFGENSDNNTDTKIFNNGVDFSIAKGSKVYSVADGTVNLVGETPYFGKIIIIVHDSGYRSIYAILSEIYIKPGDKVRLNQIIARSGEDSEGQLLHFEFWHDESPLNPRDWLRF